MKEQHRLDNSDEILERDPPDAGSIADGDAQLDQEPPNVSTAQPPAAGIMGDHDETEEEAEQIESDLESLRNDFGALSERHVRLAAEFDNYRKRVDRERSEAWGRAQADLAARLLDALDDLERVSQHADTTAPDALLQGVQLVERKLRHALESAGLEQVDAAGVRFDPNSMEAVAMIGAESEEEDDVVSDVFQPGYRFKGSLIRPARVRVKKHGA